jgi:signal transduction histidine kinase
VLVTATLLQGLIIFIVVEPIGARFAAGRADDVARDVAGALGELEEATEMAVAGVLREHRPDLRSLVVVFLPENGPPIFDRPMPPRAFADMGLVPLLGADSARVRAFPGPRSGHRPPREGGRGGPPRFDEEDRLRGRSEVLARYPVSARSGLRGEVVVTGRRHPSRLWPEHTPRPILVFLPVAIALAAAGGLLLFRVLLRRLRALEELAGRVARGDLAARVVDPGSDEIGRLGRSLNLMTESLSDARDRIETQDAQRRRLLADVSHELATPLTSIRGYAETLLDPGVPKSESERTEYLENVLDESNRMDLLIQDLFELTRLEAGAERLELERLDWSALCRRIVERFAARAKDAAITISWRGVDRAAWVNADGRRLEQVLENLLLNALRYVPRGGVVEVSVEDAAAGHVLRVEDDGPGIPEDDLPHVFDRFYRADPSRTDGGSGLGLAIVKEIVARHGGRIFAANQEGGGAAFQVELPAVP